MKILILLLGILSYSYLPTMVGKYRWRKGFEKREDKEIMLTFDDGPDSLYTERVLDLLYKEDIRASFFVVTDFAKENKDILYRMKDEGHTIGIHSRNHRRIFFRGYRYTKEDLEKSLEDMNKLGIEIKYYRPPWGRINIFSDFILREHGIKKILWNVMAKDWSKNSSAKDIEERLLAQVKEGSIICLHDGRGKDKAPERMILALSRVIVDLKAEGYKFITVGDYYK